MDEYCQRMKWYLNVPKILHVYWGGSQLPYLRFLTVKSFMKLNPDWEVVLWQPEVPAKKLVTWYQNVQQYDGGCKNYLKELLSLPIQIKTVDFKQFGLSNNMSEVHKSDFLRYGFLAQYGGVWSDMDILYFRPITDLKVNKPENKDIETFVSICWYGHSNGFFLASKDSKFFERMASIAKDGYKASDYLSLGPTLCNNNYSTLESINKFSLALDFGMEAVYAHDCYQMVASYGDNSQARFTDYSIGCHWYAGTLEAGDFLQTTNGGLENLPDNVLGRLLKNINYV